MLLTTTQNTTQVLFMDLEGRLPAIDLQSENITADWTSILSAVKTRHNSPPIVQSNTHQRRHEAGCQQLGGVFNQNQVV